MASADEILRQVADHYSGKLAAHGATARGVDWNSEESHALRHAQFLRLLGNDRGSSIVDLGCGYGDFFSFLRVQGFSGPYAGYDISAAMIAAARELHGEGPDRSWHVGSVPAESLDYAIASGLLNVKGDTSLADWTTHLHSVIDVLAKAGRRGFAFNVLTSSGDPSLRRSDLFYADPVEMIRYCIGRFGRSVALLQDYGLWEFTLLVRREP